MEPGERTGRDDGGVDGSGGPPRQLGRYRIVAELGRGSTSIVYLGVLAGPKGFNKLFALKQLRAALAKDPAFVAMFLAEARLGARLSHPNVVSTLEIEDDEALPYIVMEYLDGQSMHQVVTAARIAFTPIPLHLHLAAISGAVEGLAYAHAAVGYDGIPLDVVHRDVSPHNIFVTFSGLPKVLDFGIAQTSDSPNMMPPSAGRASYMSPEQAAGEPVDARSDLFSLGVMLWEAATRKRFWSEALGKAEILQALASRRLPATRLSAVANVAPDLQSIVLNATAPDREDRYPSAMALQEDLRAALLRLTPTSLPRDLGRRMVPLFAHERARLQAAIDTELETPSHVTVSEPAVRTPTTRDFSARTPEPESAAPVETSPVHRAPELESVVSVETSSVHWAPEAESVVPVETSPVHRTPEPGRVMETGPLPSLPIFARSRMDTISGWMAQHQGLAVGALALGLTAGVGISILRSHDDSVHANRAPSAVSVPREVASAATVVDVAPIERPPADPEPESVRAQSTPPSAPAMPAESEHAVNVETLPHAWKPSRTFVPRSNDAARMSEMRSGPPSGLAASAPSLTQASRVSDSAATHGPPLRPIDSVNPYGP